MRIARVSDQMVFEVFGTDRDRQVMPARNFAETVTWFLIWEHGMWQWVQGQHYVPYVEN